MVKNKNIIRKQTLHFQYNGKADGIALQKEVSDWCTQTLIPEIEQQLDSLGIIDEYITIDKLEIDATGERSDWEQKIRNELMSDLQISLSKHKTILKKEDRVETRSRKLDELILYYFEHGYLPWWSSLLMQDGIEPLIIKWINSEKDKSQTDRIRKHLKKVISGPVADRIVKLIPQKQFFQFLKNNVGVDNELRNDLEGFFEIIFESGISAGKQRKVLQPVFQFTLVAAIQGKLKEHYIQLLETLYDELSNQNTVSLLLETKPFDKVPDENPLPKAWRQLLETKNKEEKPATENLGKKPVKLNYNKLIDEIKELKQTDKSADQSALETEGIYVENAGAVIIAAFLPTLFSKLKITSEGGMSAPAQAAKLIQYAVTGSANIQEYDLVLPKVLCGLDIELPLDTDTEITGFQKKEVEEMLSSVIEHWAVIKNTSIEGLRESFLKRNGKLSFVNNEWLLQVEQKGYDMLLQQLPWNIGMIKLPWMNNLLKTEWT